jgi:hypothetical protein
LLCGHSQWRDSITQFALALTAPPGSPPVTLSSVEFVSATPTEATSVALHSWFDVPTQHKPANVSQRVVPLAALLSLAALIAFAALAWRMRERALARRDALIGALAVVALVTLVLTAFAPRAFLFGNGTLAWICAAAAVACAVFDYVPKTLRDKLGRVPVNAAIALLFAVGTVALGGWMFLWAIAVALWAMFAHRFAQLAARLTPSIVFLPVIAIGGIVQAAHAKYIGLPTHVLVDPSSALGDAIHTTAALPAIAAALLLVHWLWPRGSTRQYDMASGIVLWLTLVGSLVAYVATASQTAATTGFAWVVLPSLVALVAWLAPKFLVQPTNVVHNVGDAKTEADLSAVVRQLFDGAADSFDAALKSDHPGTALSPLKRMREIAPASAMTYAAELRYALANGALREGDAAYRALKESAPKTIGDDAKEALLDFAYRSNDYDYLTTLASTLPGSERRSRLLAYCRLLSSPHDGAASIDDALKLLDDAPKPNTLALERVELHLLKDDWHAAQRALAESPIAPQSTIGETYVARLGMRASGVAAYADQVQKLVTWNPQLATAQAAMGELLLAQGNAKGARARFLVALKAEPMLWPLKKQIQRIDRAAQATEATVQSSSRAD